MDHTVLGMMHHNPFENIGMYEQPKPRFIFKMPRVVPDQKAKFESDELFRRLSRESEVKYTGHRDRPTEERVTRFLKACQEGHTEIAFSATGTNLHLVFNPPNSAYMSESQCDYEKDQQKVNIKSSFIMNGVCVRWRGYIDLERLDGVGCVEFDEEAAMREDATLRDQMERYTQRLREYEDNKPRYRLDRADQDELRMPNNHLGHHGHHGTVTSRCHGPPRGERRMT
ncbi:protein big brother-like [Anthonomus grandis grandis]|uniref:protein big brother-like n=1 Tax=Anthonomus grandis grandis TaxID=2921223 RepID=UPI0021663A9B|nr:protein big brother-like [Anthonomus grandis grandis]